VIDLSRLLLSFHVTNCVLMSAVKVKKKQRLKVKTTHKLSNKTIKQHANHVGLTTTVTITFKFMKSFIITTVDSDDKCF